MSIEKNKALVRNARAPVPTSLTEAIYARAKEIEFDNVVSTTINRFKPYTKMKEGVKEKQIEGELIQALRQHIPGDKVGYQQSSRGGGVDIVIGKDIAIEMKIIKGETELWNLTGQLKAYSKNYDKLYVWMYDLNSIIKPQRLSEFKQDLTEMGVKNMRS